MGKHKKWTLEDKVKIVKEFKKGATISYLNNKYDISGCGTVSRWNKEYAKEAGIRVIRTHDFRHSCASLLINNGANIMIVAKYLGHAKIDETLNTYSHLFQSKLDDAVQTINQVINENNKL